MGERKRHSWQWWELITRVDRAGTDQPARTRDGSRRPHAARTSRVEPPRLRQQRDPAGTDSSQCEVSRQGDVNPVFVTGGTGYLGRPLITALLERGFVVHALARPSRCRDFHPVQST